MTHIMDFKELILEVRQRIKEKIESSPHQYDQVDIDKVAQNDWSVLRYIDYNRGDVNKSVEQLNESLKWRHSYDLNSLSLDDFPQEFFKIGSMFVCDIDRSKRPVLYIRAKAFRNYPKIETIFRKFIVKLIDKVDSEANELGYTMVFDQTGIGMADADMNTLLFMISTMKNYFPKGLQLVIVYNLPKLIYPLFSIGKLWMATLQKNIKLVYGKGIKELIADESLPNYLGGTSRIVFTTHPKKSKPLEELAQSLGLTTNDVKVYIKNTGKVITDSRILSMVGHY